MKLRQKCDWVFVSNKSFPLRFPFRLYQAITSGDMNWHLQPWKAHVSAQKNKGYHTPFCLSTSSNLFTRTMQNHSYLNRWWWFAMNKGNWERSCELSTICQPLKKSNSVIKNVGMKKETDRCRNLSKRGQKQNKAIGFWRMKRRISMGNNPMVGATVAVAVAVAESLK